MATITGAHHIAFTVQDVERSAAWYGDLLGMQSLLASEDDVVSLRVMVHPDSGWIIGLRQYHQRADGPFDEFRTGLDHLALTVASRAELTDWEAALEARSVTYTPAVETPIGTVIAFRDPDNIQLEFWLPVDA
jgi:glyoxylase I family protein